MMKQILNAMEKKWLSVSVPTLKSAPSPVTSQFVTSSSVAFVG